MQHLEYILHELFDFSSLFDTLRRLREKALPRPIKRKPAFVNFELVNECDLNSDVGSHVIFHSVEDQVPFYILQVSLLHLFEELKVTLTFELFK